MYDADYLLEKSLHYQFEFSVTVLISTLVSFYAMFIFMISTDGSWIKASWVKFLEMGGAVSYPLYLLHMGIGMSFINVAYPYFPPLVVLGLAVVGIVLLSWGVHRFGERPLADWLRTRLTQLEQRHASTLQRWRPYGLCLQSQLTRKRHNRCSMHVLVRRISDNISEFKLI